MTAFPQQPFSQTRHLNNKAGHPGLLAPTLLFQKKATTTQSAPLHLVSDLLKQPDKLLVQNQKPSPKAILHPLFANRSVVSQPVANNGLVLANTPMQQQIQAKIIQSGLNEWHLGVKETQGKNLGPRINQYAANAKFGSGKEWCGFFTAWNFSQAGFKYPENFASYQKSRDFFLYRSYTNRSASTNQQLDHLRMEHQSTGSKRQYFMMPGSAGLDFIQKYAKDYTHLDLNTMIFNWNQLPVQAGDVALFGRGHVGLVISYNPSTGILQTVEGNTTGQGPDGKTWSNAVVRKTYDLSKASDQAKFDGFGRAALDDFST